MNNYVIIICESDGEGIECVWDSKRKKIRAVFICIPIPRWHTKYMCMRCMLCIITLDG